MNFLWMKISEWLKELLVAGIIGNLSGLFDGINDTPDHAMHLKCPEALC